MAINFSDRFRALWARLFSGVDLDEYYEKIYVDKLFRTRDFRSVKRTLYPTGRGKPEDPRSVFSFFNDLQTTPSQAFVDEARSFFLNITSGVEEESDKVKIIAKWVNDHANYQDDSSRWGSPEYWSSPFDLWVQYKKEGSFYDDCDGSAVLICWACGLIGVPPARRYVWCGYAVKGKQSEGHANMIYDSIRKPIAHIEGSWYPDQNQAYWLGYAFGNTKAYVSPWIIFNEEEVRA